MVSQPDQGPIPPGSAQRQRKRCNQKIYYVYSTMKIERSEDRELNQARSKPDTVDRPVRTARTIVHNTVANSQTIQDIATVTIESE